MAFNPNLYLDTVRMLAGGRTQVELSEKLAECVKKSKSTGGVSKLQLEIVVRPDGPDGQYFLTSAIKETFPKVNHGKTLVWDTPEGNLTRKNPDSYELDLVSVETPKQQTETVKVNN